MDLLSFLKGLLAFAFAIMFIFIAYKTRKSGNPFQVFLYIIIEAIAIVGIIIVSWWAVDSSFKKALLTRFGNTPILSRGELALHGCVKNVGNYKINEVTLHIKVINNASAGAAGQRGSDRPNTLEEDIVVVTNLAPSTQKCFKKRIDYPPYFRLANIQRHITAN